eukprot:CAMPEP_0118684596 /NCGR_PEP_ID=MMETSP0800-20121206/6740_1 /TAXON_ID=210618 ORGANISM="Striatella unipunctata, Strain CCMP2910" /NCGR_SAMPLE_ID=MMETSP0800 /ASSEMBLY_ACC=CAM_ASM_000638 /LENGTH=146 /DNA_ID=CAMNT_0006581337 /DNA_START=100 /DNA_END=540 /DNA_ORIENTATION=-
MPRILNSNDFSRNRRRGTRSNSLNSMGSKKSMGSRGGTPNTSIIMKETGTSSSWRVASESNMLKRSEVRLSNDLVNAHYQEAAMKRVNSAGWGQYVDVTPATMQRSQRLVRRQQQQQQASAGTQPTLGAPAAPEQNQAHWQSYFAV